MILLISSLKITLKHNYHLSDSQTLKIVEVTEYREYIREEKKPKLIGEPLVIWSPMRVNLSTTRGSFLALV